MRQLLPSPDEEADGLFELSVTVMIDRIVLSEEAEQASLVLLREGCRGIGWIVLSEEA